MVLAMKGTNNEGSSPLSSRLVHVAALRETVIGATLSTGSHRASGVTSLVGRVVVADGGITSPVVVAPNQLSDSSEGLLLQITPKSRHGATSWSTPSRREVG